MERGVGMKYVLSVGGSMIVPKEVDVSFLKKLRAIVKRSRHRFIIITGGGSTARIYQKAGRSFKADDKSLDWIGIHATWVNADFVRSVFGRLAHPKIIMDYSKKSEFSFKKKVLVGGGWKPGFTTDYDAVLAAKHTGAKVVINLTNVDYVYDKDPNKYTGAKPFHELTWNRMFKLMGSKFIPGGNWPFDPKACRLAKKHGVSVVIMNGNNLKNLENFLKGKKFKGTMIG